MTGERRESSETLLTVLVAFCANLLIAIAKLAAGLLSGSTAMLAEAAHSAADTVNQILLLVSLPLSRRQPDETHPFGHGMERYFWALMAAVLMFTGGAVFSIVEGARVVAHGGGERSLTVAFAVLGIAFVADGASLVRAVRQSRRGARAAGTSFFAHVRESSDPTTKVVLAEDTAAVVGVVIAFGGILLLALTGDPVWDGIASIAIGVLLAAVAYAIGRDAKERLLGRAASARHRAAIERAIGGHPAVRGVSEVLSLQVGPEDLLVAVRLELADRLSTDDIEQVMDELQDAVGQAVGQVHHLFLDPTPMPSGGRA